MREETWIDRTEALARERGLSLSGLAKKAGHDPSFFRKARDRDSAGPKQDTAAAIARALRMPVTAYIDKVFGNLSDRPDTPQSSEIQLSPEIALRLGAGGGGVVDQIIDAEIGSDLPQELIKTQWGLPASFLRHEAKVPPSAAHVLEISGNSMVDPTHPTAFGTLLPGDRVIIDTTDRIPSPPGLFALWDGYGVVVKQVDLVYGADPARVRLSSINPAYPPYEITAEEARIYGRVRARITVV